MADVFVSYVSEDRAIAEKISRGLEEAGLSVWWDRHIQGGVDFGSEIEHQLGAAKTVVVLWSAASRASKWVRDEAQQARDENKLIPVRLDEVQPPLGFRQTHAIDFAGWNGDSKSGIFSGLVGSVRRLVGGAMGSPVAEPAPSLEPLRGRWGVSKRWLIVGIAVFVAGAAALWVLVPSLVPRQATNGDDGSVQVGAFKMSTKSDELERFADGLAGAIVRVFATNGIKTIAPRADGGSGVAPNADTEFELRGRVDRDGDDLVASADIANRRDGLVLWSTTAKRDAAQSQILQEQFSAYIADVLRCGLHFRELSNGVVSTDVFARYLRLCEAFNNYDHQGEQTPELTRHIVEAAPQNAFSYGLQATANALVSTTPTSSGASRPAAEIARLRKIVYDSAQAAIAIDPKADPYYARAIVVDPAVGAAERENLLQKSIEREGGGGPLYAYSTLLINVGRIDEARINVERALNGNPLDKQYLGLSAFLAGWLGNIEVMRHGFDEMLRKLILTKEQVDAGRFWSEFFFGDPAIAKAINEGDKVMSDRCWKGVVDALVAETRLSEDELEAICPDAPDFLQGYFGHIDKAFLWAEANRTAQNGPLTDGNRDLFLPRMHLVRADPRFMPLATRLGLVDYWLDTDQWPDFCATEKLPYDCKEAALAARAAATSKR